MSNKTRLEKNLDLYLFWVKCITKCWDNPHIPQPDFHTMEVCGKIFANIRSCGFDEDVYQKIVEPYVSSYEGFLGWCHHHHRNDIKSRPDIPRLDFLLEHLDYCLNWLEANKWE